MVRRCNLAEVEEDSVRLPMHGIYARYGVYASSSCLGGALGGFIYVAS
jgi:hypothetical protein